MLHNLEIYKMPTLIFLIFASCSLSHKKTHFTRIPPPHPIPLNGIIMVANGTVNPNISELIKMTFADSQHDDRHEPSNLEWFTF